MNDLKLDILVMAVHPDDAELGCSGTILAHQIQGKKVGIVDFTQGELGTRGTPELRKKEAEASSHILGIQIRHNLLFRDGFFRNDETHQLEVIKIIRKYKPEIVLANAISDRHPDHGRASQLAIDSCFLSGLSQIKTEYENKNQEAWRPQQVYHYIQDRLMIPNLVIDITPFWDKKIEAIKAFKSQFYDPTSKEPMTYISNPDFLSFIEARAKEMGHLIGVKYGEGFTTNKIVGTSNLFNLI